MKALILTLTLMTFMSCTSDDGDEKSNLDVAFELSVKGSDGVDLLNPANPHSFDQSKIKLFYLIDGKKKEVYDANMDYPRNFLIYQHENEYRMRVFVNHSEKEETPETYIRWNETDTDTISSKIYRTNSLVRIDKVWLNKQLVWTASESTEPFYEMKK